MVSYYLLCPNISGLFEWQMNWDIKAGKYLFATIDPFIVDVKLCCIYVKILYCFSMPQVLNSIFGWPKAEVGFQLFWNLVNRLVYLRFWIFKIRHNNLLFFSSYNVYNVY